MRKPLAQATLVGAGNSINLAATNTFTLSGSSHQIVTGKALGEDWIVGFNSSDAIAFSAADFANFSARANHMSQSRANTLILLDANDGITLYDTQAP